MVGPIIKNCIFFVVVYTFIACTLNHNICMLRFVSCVCVYVCVHVGVLRVCLHIYRYIGTYIDRSKIAHASAHTSIYMHRFIIYDFMFFFPFIFFSIVSYTYDNNSIFYMQKQKVLSQWDSIHSLIT